MKCLTGNQIQSLIDGEIPNFQSEKYHQHIIACSLCQKQYDDQKLLAQSIKDLINASFQSPEWITEFMIPKKIIKPKLKIIRISVWIEVAALLIPAFFVWKIAIKPQKDFKPTAENIRMYEMCNTVDANTVYQENMIITTVTDENGKVIESLSN